MNSRPTAAGMSRSLRPCAAAAIALCWAEDLDGIVFYFFSRRLIFAVLFVLFVLVMLGRAIAVVFSIMCRNLGRAGALSPGVSTVRVASGFAESSSR